MASGFGDDAPAAGSAGSPFGPAGGRKRGVRPAIPAFEYERTRAGDLLRGQGVADSLAWGSPAARESTGVFAIRQKRHLAEPAHRATGTGDALHAFHSKFHVAAIPVTQRSIKTMESTAVRASLDPTAPPPPASAVRDTDARRHKAHGTGAPFAGYDHVDELLRPRPSTAAVESAWDSAHHSFGAPGTLGRSSSPRPRSAAADFHESGAGVRATLSPAYAPPAEPAAGRKQFAAAAHRGDSAALLMLHNPSAIPAGFPDEGSARYRRGRGGAGGAGNPASVDHVGEILSGARAAAVRNAAAAASPRSAASYSYSSTATGSAAAPFALSSAREMAGVGPRRTSISGSVAGGGSSAGAAMFAGSGAAAALGHGYGGSAGYGGGDGGYGGGARALKYARDLSGHHGIITGTGVRGAVDDRPQ